jgi:hypothetical protein
MRRIERTEASKRDYQRVIATPKHRDFDNLLPAILTLVATDTALPAKYVDHAMRGNGRSPPAATRQQATFDLEPADDRLSPGQFRSYGMAK